MIKDLTIRGYRITLREPESKETWRALDGAAAEEFKRSEYSTWGYGAGEAVRNSTRILRASGASLSEHPLHSVAKFTLLVWIVR